MTAGAATVSLTVDVAPLRAALARLVERWPALGEGWAWPSERGVWHYFRSGGSLCGEWTIPFDAPASVFAPEALHALDERPACPDCLWSWGSDA